MFDLKNCLDSTSAISSLASPVGPSPYGWLDTDTSRGSGPDRALASPSLPPVNEKEPLMPDTSGPKCAASLNSAALQSSLENRLRARMEGRGAPEYVLTWKHWDMPSGPPICALRASGRRISGKDSTGAGTWPTPNAQEFGCRDVERTQERRKECKERTGNGNGFGLTLGQAVMLNVVGWASPNALPPNRGGLQTNPQKALERVAQGHQMNLDDAATLVAGWATPKAADGRGSPYTPTETRRSELRKQMPAGWATPTTRDHKDTGTLENVPVNCLLGRQAPLSIAPTERRAGYALNPEFSRWLMGFPVAWGSCGAMAMQSCRSSRQSSSSPS